jgi:hypothetical protein
MLRNLFAILLMTLMAVPAVASPHEDRHQDMPGMTMTMARPGHDRHQRQDPNTQFHLCIGCAVSCGTGNAVIEPMLPPVEIPAKSLSEKLVPHLLTPETPPPRA